MDRFDYSYLRPKKGEQLRARHAAAPIRDDLQVLSVENGIVVPCGLLAPNYGDYGTCYVLDANGSMVEESLLIDPRSERLEAADPSFKDLRVVWLGPFIPQWGHFLLDCTARMWYLLEDDPDVDAWVFAGTRGCENRLDENYLEFLELCGIADKVMIVDEPVRFREVVIPEASSRRKADGFKYYSLATRRLFEHVCHAAHEAAPAEPESLPNRVLLSRAHFSGSRNTELGGEIVEDFFARNGYSVVYPEELPLSALIRMLAAAETVASVSGSIAHNAILAPGGAEQVIVERLPWNNPAQLVCDLTRTSRTVFIDGNYSFLPVHIGAGPFLFAWNDRFRSFACDRGYAGPDPELVSEARLRKLVWRYLMVRRRMYAPQWADEFTDPELYEEVRTEMHANLGDWLGRASALSATLWMPVSLLHFAKRAARRLMGRC